MNSESFLQRDGGAAAPAAEGGGLRPAKRRVEWWVRIAGGMIVARAAFLAIPYATHGGVTGMVFWMLGIDSVLWNVPLLIVALVGVAIAVRRRPFWTRPRVVGTALLTCGVVALRANRRAAAVAPAPLMIRFVAECQFLIAPTASD